MSHFRGLRRDSDSLRQVALHQHQDLLGSDLVQRSTLFLLHSFPGSLSTQSKAQVMTGDPGRSSGQEGRKVSLRSSGRASDSHTEEDASALPTTLPATHSRPPRRSGRSPSTENLAESIASGFASPLTMIGSLRRRSHSLVNERARRTCDAGVTSESREKYGGGSPAPNSGVCSRCSCPGRSRSVSLSWR